MVNIEYANAYREVLEILKYISKEDYNKIPKENILLYETYANSDYEFTYNPLKTLDEQNVSKIARGIIAILFRDYWATEMQRNKIILKQNYDKIKLEEKKKEKYDPNNIFNNNYRNTAIDNKENNQETALVDISKMKWYKKIWKLFKDLFRK